MMKIFGTEGFIDGSPHDLFEESSDDSSSPRHNNIDIFKNSEMISNLFKFSAGNILTVDIDSFSKESIDTIQLKNNYNVFSVSSLFGTIVSNTPLSIPNFLIDDFLNNPDYDPSIDALETFELLNKKQKSDYIDFVKNVIRNKNDQYLLKKSKFSSLKTVLLFVHSSENINCLAHSTKTGIYMSTLIYMCSKDKQIFEQTIQLIESLFEQTRNELVIWNFLISMFLAKKYEMMIKILQIPIAKKYITRNQSMFFSFMTNHFLVDRATNSKATTNETPSSKQLESKTMEQIKEVDFIDIIESMVNQNRVQTPLLISNFFKMYVNCHLVSDFWFLNKFFMNEDYSFFEHLKRLTNPQTNMNLKIIAPLMFNADLQDDAIENIQKLENEDEQIRYLKDHNIIQDRKQNCLDFFKIFSHSKWFSQIWLDMGLICEDGFLECLNQIWDIIQEHTNIHIINVQEDSRSLTSQMHQKKKKIGSEKKNVHKIQDYDFYNMHRQLMEQVKCDSPEDAKEIDNLIDKIRSCIIERNHVVKHFSMLIRNRMYKEADQFLEHKNKQFILFNCMSPFIANSINEMECVRILFKHDLNWSMCCVHGDTTYENIFHLLFEQSNFRQNAKECFELIKKHNVHVTYKKQWESKNSDGISMKDFCDFLGYNHLFLDDSPKLIHSKRVIMDQDVWNKIILFVDFSNPVQFSFWFRTINRSSYSTGRDQIWCLINEMFKYRSTVIGKFSVLFCSLFYDIQVLSAFLLKDFCAQFYMKWDEAFDILDKYGKWDHDKKNSVLHFEKVLNLISLKDFMIERIPFEQMQCVNLKTELKMFSKTEIFDIFGVKIDYNMLKYFMCKFIGKIKEDNTPTWNQHYEKNKSSIESFTL